MSSFFDIFGKKGFKLWLILMQYKAALILIIFGFIFVFSEAFCKESGTLAGTVVEKNSGEYVIGISVMLFPADTSAKKPLRGAYSNKFGFYSLPNIQKGDYRLIVRGIGYEKAEKKISFSGERDSVINLELVPKDIQMEEVTVQSGRISKGGITINSVDLDPSFIAKMPSLGEIDVFRSLQLLPGVAQANELSSGLYIRGGSPDQNLTLLDGVIVYNPSHLGGFLSTFNSDALRDIRLIKGAFPAEYGGRLSSVLDMTMKEGTKEKISGKGGISLISAKMTVEGPINEDMTFMISGRRMYLDVLTGIAFSDEDNVPGYYFYDLNAKTNYKISDNDRIFLSGFFGRDVLTSPEDESDEMELFWGNKTGNLRWMHIVSPDLFTNFSLIYTDYNFNTNLIDKEANKQMEIVSGIQDIMLRGDAQYFPGENHVVKAGIEAAFHSFDASANTDIFNDEMEEVEGNIIKTMDAAFFIQDEWKISPLFTANLGMRFYYFESGSYFNPEPRLSASYQLTEDIKLSVAFAAANQYLHLLVRNDITLPTDLWFPSTETIKPSRSYQGSLGMETTLFDGSYLFSTEVYYKYMQNIYEYKDNAEFSYYVPLEEQFTSGRGEAYGIELFLNKRAGKFTGWIGYTLAWTRRKFDELNNGNWFSPRFDRRHDVSVVVTYQPWESWEFSAAWVYGTGQAYTMPTGTYFYTDVGEDYNDERYYYYEKYQYTDRNAFRLPAYHRLDFNAIHHYEWFGLPFQFYISIYNIYNRRNPFAWYIDYDSVETEEGWKDVKKLKQLSLFPFIPTIGLSFEF